MKRLTPLKIIRAHCLECGNGSYRKVKECKAKDCLFYFFRLGLNPRLKGKRRDNISLWNNLKVTDTLLWHKNSKKGIVEAVGNPKSHD